MYVLYTVIIKYIHIFNDSSIRPRMEIVRWPNTRVVKCKYYVSQKRNEANDKDQRYNVLLTFKY